MVAVRFAAEQRWSIACGETAGHSALGMKSCGAATLIFDKGRQTSLLRSFTTLVVAFPRLAPWAISPSCSAANRSDRSIYHQLTDALLSILKRKVAPPIAHRRNAPNLLNYHDRFSPARGTRNISNFNLNANFGAAELSVHSGGKWSSFMRSSPNLARSSRSLVSRYAALLATNSLSRRVNSYRSPSGGTPHI